MAMKKIFSVDACLCVLACCVALALGSCTQGKNAGQAAPPADPGAGEYGFHYGPPSPDSVRAVIARVYGYFTANPAWQIVDDSTGIPIRDTSHIVRSADLNQGGNDVISLWGYPMGVTYAGMLKAAEATGDTAYRAYPIKNLDFFFDWLPYFQRIDSAFGPTGNSFQPIIHTGSLDDCGAMGAALIKVYKVNRDPRFLPAINHIADYISRGQFRLPDGTLARRRPQPQSVWGDDAYMAIPFLAQMGDLTHDTRYYDDAVKQVRQMTHYLFRPDKKLFTHGVNVHNPYSPGFFWGRANGWVMMAMVELLDVLPENYKGRDEILTILRTHVQGVAEAQGSDGLWHNLLDKEDSYPETSCSAMFVYAIAHAINKGWIDHTFGPVAQAGWNGVATKVRANGQVEGTCWGTTLASDNVYYYHRPASPNASQGYGPVFFAAAEMLELLANKNIEIR